MKDKDFWITVPEGKVGFFGTGSGALKAITIAIGGETLVFTVSDLFRPAQEVKNEK